MNLDRIVLSQGAHDTPEEGTCLMEAVSMLAGETFGDTPSCVSPVLAVFGARLNDALLPGRMDLEPRLRALAPFLIGTAHRPEDDQRWGLMAADWLIRVHLPTWLHLAGLQHEATVLAESPEIVSWDALPQAQITAARTAARTAALGAARAAAWAAARTATWDAAWAAAGAAARVAARDAARDAARATAGDAARDAARATAGDAALGATWDAARAAARDAAWDAARDAAWDATWAAAWAGAALPPAVRQLQDSALALFERMVMPT